MGHESRRRSNPPQGVLPVQGGAVQRRQTTTERRELTSPATVPRGRLDKAWKRFKPLEAVYHFYSVRKATPVHELVSGGLGYVYFAHVPKIETTIRIAISLIAESASKVFSKDALCCWVT